MKFTYVASRFETAEKAMEKLHEQQLPYSPTGADYVMGEYECENEEAWEKWYTEQMLGTMTREGFSYVYLLENDTLRRSVNGI